MRRTPRRHLAGGFGPLLFSLCQVLRLSDPRVIPIYRGNLSIFRTRLNPKEWPLVYAWKILRPQHSVKKEDVLIAEKCLEIGERQKELYPPNSLQRVIYDGDPCFIPHPPLIILRIMLSWRFYLLERKNGNLNFKLGWKFLKILFYKHREYSLYRSAARTRFGGQSAVESAVESP